MRTEKNIKAARDWIVLHHKLGLDVDLTEEEMLRVQHLFAALEWVLGLGDEDGDNPAGGDLETIRDRCNAELNRRAQSN